MLHDAPQSEQVVEEGEQQYEMRRQISRKPPYYLALLQTNYIFLLQKNIRPNKKYPKISKNIIIAY